MAETRSRRRSSKMKWVFLFLPSITTCTTTTDISAWKKNLCTKCMYGFRDEETRNKVCDYLSTVSGIDYDRFKHTVNESIKDIRPIVYKIYELFDEFEITELTRLMKKVLLEGLRHTDRNIQKVSGFLLRNMELVKMLN